MSKDLIQKIIEAGALAPSGSNFQPWRFEVSGDTIRVFALPEKDHPVLNFRNRGTWLAHGALIENMTVAASALGANLSVDIFPDKNQPTLTAVIGLENAEPSKNDLYECIKLRVTNRKPYEKTPLSRNEIKSLMFATKSFNDGVGAAWIEERKHLNALGVASSAAEIINLENKVLHKLFFNEIVWSRDEEKMRGGGMYVKTMEVPRPAEFALKYLFSRWSIMRHLAKAGVPRAIAKNNANVYASSGAMCVLTAPSDDKDFVSAGRVMERIWLTATQLGLGAQVMAGIVFLRQRIVENGMPSLNSKHMKLAEQAHNTISEIVSVPHGHVVVAMMRVGRSDPPSAYSTKRPPEIMWQ